MSEKNTLHIERPADKSETNAGVEGVHAGSNGVLSAGDDEETAIIEHVVPLTADEARGVLLAVVLYERDKKPAWLTYNALQCVFCDQAILHSIRPFIDKQATDRDIYAMPARDAILDAVARIPDIARMAPRLDVDISELVKLAFMVACRSVILEMLRGFAARASFISSEIDEGDSIGKAVFAIMHDANELRNAYVRAASVLAQATKAEKKTQE